MTAILHRPAEIRNCMQCTSGYTLMYGYRLGALPVLCGSLDRRIAVGRGTRARHRPAYRWPPCRCARAIVGHAALYALADRPATNGSGAEAADLRRSDAQFSRGAR